MLIKMLSLLSFCIVCILCLTPISHAQDNRIPVIRLGNIDSSRHLVLTTRTEILANPYLTCSDPGCQITDFMASFTAFDNTQKNQKDKNRFWGPFEVKSTKLPDRIIDLINEWSGPDVKIYIENVHVNCSDKTLAANAVFLKYDR